MIKPPRHETGASHADRLESQRHFVHALGDTRLAAAMEFTQGPRRSGSKQQEIYQFRARCGGRNEGRNVSCCSRWSCGCQTRESVHEWSFLSRGMS